MAKKRILYFIVGIFIGFVAGGLIGAGVVSGNYLERISELESIHSKLAYDNQQLRIENRTAREALARSTGWVGAADQTISASEITAFNTSNRIIDSLGLSDEIRADTRQLGHDLDAIEGILGQIEQRSAAPE